MQIQKSVMAVLAEVIVMMLTVVSGAQWGRLHDNNDRIGGGDTVLTGKLEKLVMDGKEYRRGNFDGAERVSIYKEYVLIRKGRGKSAAVYIPKESIEYLVLD